MTIQSTTRYSAARQRRRYIYTRRSENKIAPPRGQNRGAGLERRGAKRPPVRAAGASPPTLAARSKTGERGDGGGVGREEPTATTTEEMGWREPAGRPARRRCRARRRSKGTGGAQRNPAAGAQAFAPSGRRQLRKRGRRERLRRKADEGHGPLHQRDGAARIPKSAEQAQRRRHTSAHGGPAAATAARSPTDGASIPPAPKLPPRATVTRRKWGPYL